MTDVDVAIIGGGVAGGAAACAFGAAGAKAVLRTVLYEKRDLSRDPNRGDALHLPTVAVLKSMGALEEFQRRGAVWMRKITFSDQRGRLQVPVALGDNSILMLNHAEIELALIDAAKSKNVAIRHQSVRAISRSEASWRIECDDGSITTRLLVGCDGAASLVRRAADISVVHKDYREAVVILHAPRPSWIEPEAGFVMLHPNGSVMVIPTSPAGQCRIIVVVKAEDAASWMAASESEIQQRLGQRQARLGELAISKRAGSHVYRLSQQHASTYIGEHLALIGDAAHVTHPSGGQGMNLAIQDAAALATLCTPYLQEGATALQHALEKYETLRRPINTRALARANRASRFQRPTPLTYITARTGLALLSLFPFGIRLMMGKLGGKH